MRRLIQIFIACIVLLSLASNASADTNTTLNISNSPPTLTQNIPDVLIIIDTPRINAFDLDDYFNDLNGDNLTFTHTTLNNVTVTINSENQVSFYPDAGYSGVQNMQFNASDIYSSATSNIFQVTVGLDTLAPQWSNPRKNRVSVYQNYHVTFSADWTDNMGLKNYILSINQGSGWQNQTSTTFTGTSNTSTFIVQISASAGSTVSWKFYAEDNYSNINVTDTQSFVVKQFTSGSDSNDSSTSSQGTTTSSQGTTSSGVGTKLDYFKEGILAENLEVDRRSLKVSLKQGANITKVIQIINTGTTIIKLNASLISMNSFAKLSENSFQISPGKTYELLLDFKAPIDAVPDQYFGFLVLNYGDKISIPIVLDIKKFESALRINVNLTENSKAVRVGNKVTALITIRNTKDIKPLESQLYYAIKNFRGDIINSKIENLTLFAVFEEERTLLVPEGTPDGDYIFYARIISGDLIDLDSDKLQIGTRFKIIAILRKFFYPTIILLLLLILFLLYLIYKRNKKKKRLLELYLLLNELRYLVKEGKTMEAMDIYKRIKLTYGQPMRKDFAKDEIKLREELNKFSKILSKTKVAPAPKTKQDATKPDKNTQTKEALKTAEISTKIPKQTTAPEPQTPTPPAEQKPTPTPKEIPKSKSENQVK